MADRQYTDYSDGGNSAAGDTDDQGTTQDEDPSARARRNGG
ncbi:hypothetical protein NKH77_29800 [Streptomyces sp. M19]